MRLNQFLPLQPRENLPASMLVAVVKQQQDGIANTSRAGSRWFRQDLG